MGFYITIRMTLSMCDITGNPYYYGKNLDKIYGYPIINIPAKYKRFLNEKNSIYRMYRMYMADADCYNESTDVVLDKFPTWKDVKKEYPDAEDQYDWTENDHNLLKEALEWFSRSTNVSFIVSWGISSN